MKKLLSFFTRSRDNWKAKCQNGKVIIKRLTNRVQKLQTSRDRWKERAQGQQVELRQLRKALEAQKTAVA